jgi:hypothetical protein
VSQNDAQGGAIGGGTSSPVPAAGQGIGGGVDLAGPGSSDTPAFVISNNTASTADPDLFGSF